MVLPFHCYSNICLLKYFFHTFLLVRLCDNPSLLVAWEVAKVWTQGIQNLPPSLDFRSRTFPTRIIGERAFLCCGHPCRLMIRGWMLRAQRAIAVCGPFCSETGSLYRQWQLSLRLSHKRSYYVYFCFIDLVMGPLSITTRVWKLS